MKKVFLLLLVAFMGVGLIAAPASSACWTSGYIFYTYSFTGGTYYYINQPIDGGYAYYYLPTGTSYESIRATLDSAAANSRRVGISGDAASCATSGYRSGGKVVYALAMPLYSY